MNKIALAEELASGGIISLVELENGAVQIQVIKAHERMFRSDIYLLADTLVTLGDMIVEYLAEIGDRERDAEREAARDAGNLELSNETEL